MHPLFKKIFDGLREDFGQPVSLRNALAAHGPHMQASLLATDCISLESVPRWYELGTHPVLNWPRLERGELQGFRVVKGYEESFLIERPEFAQIGVRKITPEWSCDISALHGFSSSKSDLWAFSNTDEMVEAKSREMIDEITQAKLAENLAHYEVRIIHSVSTGDHFVRHAWDDRLWLANDGGSHHLAAAKYIAARLGQSVTLTAKLYTYSLDAAAIASLRQDFDLFAIPYDAPVWKALRDALCTFKVTWLHIPLPEPFDGIRGVLLPKAERRSMCVSAEFRHAGILDLGAHLADLAGRQVVP